MSVEHLEVGLNKQLELASVLDTPDEVRLDMPIGPACMQPFGYVHGGATLTLLEACASRGAQLMCDFEREACFGVHVDVRHVKAGVSGTVHGRAVFEKEQDLGPRGRKQRWRVEATDDAGDVMSHGTFDTQIVPLEYLQTKGYAVKPQS